MSALAGRRPIPTLIHRRRQVCRRPGPSRGIARGSHPAQARHRSQSIGSHSPRMPPTRPAGGGRNRDGTVIRPAVPPAPTFAHGRNCHAHRPGNNSLLSLPLLKIKPVLEFCGQPFWLFSRMLSRQMTAVGSLSTRRLTCLHERSSSSCGYGIFEPNRPRRRQSFNRALPSFP